MWLIQQSTVSSGLPSQEARRLSRILWHHWEAECQGNAQSFVVPDYDHFILGVKVVLVLRNKFFFFEREQMCSYKIILVIGPWIVIHQSW